jgi:hypothetical protein
LKAPGVAPGSGNNNVSIYVYVYMCVEEYTHMYVCGLVLP